VETELPSDPASTPVPDGRAVSDAAPPAATAPVSAAAVPVAVSVPAAATPPPLPSPYRDRSTALVIFGVAQIILGLLAALMVPLIGLSAFLTRAAPGGGVRPVQLVSSAGVYLFAAGILIALGVGSVQAKRWARALTLVISWYWMIAGFLVTILLTAVLPVMMRGVLRAQQNATGAPTGNASTGVMAVILTVMISFCAFFAVVVPFAFVVFYSRKNVQETCRHRNPNESWTDRTPLPVLGASVILGVGALYFLLVGVTTPMFPFFGRYLTGLPGAAGMILLGTLDVYLAIALFRLNAAAWWIATVSTAVRLLSLSLTFGRADLLQAYSKIGWSDEQLRVMKTNPIFHSHVILWWGLFSMCVFFGYLLWLKRYFKVPAGPPQAEPLPAEAV
jgi:hypothetical protein